MSRRSLLPFIPKPNWTLVTESIKSEIEDIPTMSDYLRDLQHRIMQNLHKDQMEALEKYIKENLGRLGYTFESREEFLQFIKERVTRIQLIPTGVNHEFYLDFDMDNKSGTLIGSYSQELTFQHSQNKVTYTLG